LTRGRQHSLTGRPEPYIHSTISASQARSSSFFPFPDGLLPRIILRIFRSSSLHSSFGIGTIQMQFLMFMSAATWHGRRPGQRVNESPVAAWPGGHQGFP
jgi:hypothetical protein